MKGQDRIKGQKGQKAQKGQWGQRGEREQEKRRRWALIGTFVTMAAVTACSPDRDAQNATADEPAAPTTDTVMVETNLGTFAIELFPDTSPESVRNFLLLVRSKFYDGLIFHRVEQAFVIQTGRYTEQFGERTSPTPPIANEAQNGLTNDHYTVAMARASGAHSATSEWFVNLKDNEGLNFKDLTSTGFGYAVFGRVIEGQSVIDEIGAIPTTRRRTLANLPTRTVVINRMYRKQQEADEGADAR